MTPETPVPRPDEALGLLADALAEEAPAPVRANVLAAVAARPRPRVSPADPISVLESAIDGVAAVLDSLSPAEWDTPHVLGELDVKRTVAHLHGADHYFGVKAGAWDGPIPADENDHRAASQAHIDHSASMTGPEVRDAWGEWSHRLIGSLRAMPSSRLGEPAKYHIFDSTLGAVLVARAFEVWTHGEDIRRATGRPLTPPPPAVLAAMTDAGSGLVPLSYGLRHGATAASVRLVLTGDGGGTWDFPLGPGAPATPTATIVTDAVAYCRLVANRVTADALDCEIEGDRELAGRVLVGASMLALD